MNVSHVCVACYQSLEVSDTCRTLFCVDAGIPLTGFSNLSVRRTQVVLQIQRITHLCSV
jgi:hypothetical protein